MKGMLPYFKHLSQTHYFGNILDVHADIEEHSIIRIIHAVIETGILEVKVFVLRLHREL